MSRVFAHLLDDGGESCFSSFVLEYISALVATIDDGIRPCKMYMVQLAFRDHL